MKKILLLFLFILFKQGLKAQSNLQGIHIANHIADKMKDTLNLNMGQRNMIYAVNLSMNNMKMAARRNISNPDSLRIVIQKIENRRDSLYSKKLPPPKYNLYLQKKRTLISIN
jgi:hypothetical protein